MLATLWVHSISDARLLLQIQVLLDMHSCMHGYLTFLFLWFCPLCFDAFPCPCLHLLLLPFACIPLWNEEAVTTNQ